MPDGVAAVAPQPVVNLGTPVQASNFAGNIPSATPGVQTPSGGIDIAGLVHGGLDAINSSITASMQDLANVQSTATGAAGSVSSGAALKAQGEIAANTATVTAAMKLQSDNAAAAANLGISPNGVSAAVQGILDSIKTGDADMMQRQKMILGKQSVSFLDDPLQWITNQVSLPFDIEAANTAKSNVDASVEALKQLTVLATDQFQVNAGIDTAASAQLLDGLNKQSLGTAQIAAGQSGFELAKLTGDFINMRQNFNMQQFSSAIQVNDQLFKQQDLVLREDEAARQERMYQLQKDFRDITMAGKLETDQMKAAVQQKLDNFTQVAGMNRITYLEYQNMTGATRQLLDRAIQNPDVQNPAGPRLGNNPADALNIANTFGLSLTPGMNIVRKSLDTDQTVVIDTLNKSGVLKGMPPAEVTNLINEGINRSVTQELANIPNSGGKYSPPPLFAVLAMNPAVAGMSLSKEMQPLAIANKNADLRPEDVMNTAINMINKKQITPAAAAAQISNLYIAIMNDNNVNRQYQRLGLKLMTPDGTGFNQQVYTGSAFGSKEVIDMSNPVVLETKLIRLIQQQKTQQMQTSGAFSPEALGYGSYPYGSGGNR